MVVSPIVPMPSNREFQLVYDVRFVIDTKNDWVCPFTWTSIESAEI